MKTNREIDTEGFALWAILCGEICSSSFVSFGKGGFVRMLFLLSLFRAFPRY